MADQDRERWTRIVATFEQSGQSQREFAKEQELPLSNLRYWIYRLRKESRPLVTEQVERSVKSAEQPEGLTLKPVRVVASVPEARREGNGLLELAGLYDAVERPVFIAPPFNVPIAAKKALVRSDTGAYLSVVGKSYEVVQFTEVAGTLVEAADSVNAIFTVAGTLESVGIRDWLIGALPEPIRVWGDDSPIRNYVLRYAGHDGYTSVVIKNMATRMVCADTLGVALGER